MIDPSKIDELIDAARARDNIVTAKLLAEIARLIVVAPHMDVRQLDLNQLTAQLLPAKVAHSGLGQDMMRPLPDNGSYAYQLYSAICFMVDARAELKMLELIRGPNFYNAIMRSAAEVQEP